VCIALASPARRICVRAQLACVALTHLLARLGIHLAHQLERIEVALAVRRRQGPQLTAHVVHRDPVSLLILDRPTWPEAAEVDMVLAWGVEFHANAHTIHGSAVLLRHTRCVEARVSLREIADQLFQLPRAREQLVALGMVGLEAGGPVRLGKLVGGDEVVFDVQFRTGAVAILGSRVVRVSLDA